jgi:hypothetical protein
MKKILLLLLLIVASFHGFSQTPGISYQAVILNPNTKELPGANAQTSILANKKVAIRFTILNQSYEQEYQEYHQTNTDAYGMINLLIGHGTRIGASYFDDILWNGLSKKLKVDIDFSGSGNNFTFLNEQELTFMPQPALSQNAQAILDNTASILAEITRATNAEALIQADVDANEAASILADETLQDNIDNLRRNVDANTTNIGNLTGLTTTANSNLVVAINEINAEKANLQSPTFIGIPLAPTAAAGTNTTQIATTAFVTDAIATFETPDATATVKGKIQLAGDLTGTAAEPTIANAAVGTAKLADASVTTAKIADNAVTTAKINDGAIVSSKIESSPSFTGTPLAPTAAAGTNSTQIATTAFVTDAISTAGTPDATATVKGKIQLAGDLTGTAAEPTIANAAVGTAKLADASVTTAKIADNAVTTAKINDGAVVSTKIESSPSFTGTPLAPTAAAGTNTTQIATTAFVTDAISTATTGNFVDLTTNQTIAGVKTFSSDAIVNGITVGRGNFNENSNTAIGLGALESNAGYANTAIGRGALAANDDAGGNTALGYVALSNNISGTDNVAIGSQALETNATGSLNTAIGKNANVASDGISNSVAIGANAIVTASNTIQLGSDGSGSHTAITSVKTSGNITAASYIKSGGTSSQYLMADGSVSEGMASVREVADEFSATVSQTNFTLTQTPSANSKVKMYINGIRISNMAYSITGTTLTYNPVYNGAYYLTVGDRIQMDYYY